MSTKKYPATMRTAWLFALALFASNASAETAAKTYKNSGYEFDVGPPPAWVVVHDVGATWDAGAPGATGSRWRNWLLDTQIDRRAGGRERYFDSAYEPVSAELVQDAGKFQIWFTPDHEKLTLHAVRVRRAGVWQDRTAPEAITLARRESEFERDMSTGTVSALIVLDDVRAGDIVRVSYTVRGANPVLGGLTDEEFAFGFTDPLLDRRARVLYDAGAHLAEHVDRRMPSSRQRRETNLLEWSMDQRALGGLVDEGSYPAWYPIVPTAVVGERRSWAEVATWARALYPAPAPLPVDLEQRIAEWKQLDGADRRIDAALRSMQEDVRYFGTELGENTHKPSEPAQTWTRRYGDCKDKARLLAAVLGRLGVDAHPALVSYADGKSVADFPPAASVFDHVIVQAQLDGKTLWLDPTQTQQRGSARARTPGDFGVALPVAPGANALVDIVAPSQTTDNIRVVSRIVPDTHETKATLHVETSYEGGAADRIRRFLTTRGIDEIGRKFLDFYRKRYGDVTSLDKVSVADDEVKNKITVVERYELKNPWLGATPSQQLIDVYSDAVGSYLELPSTAERTAPLAISRPRDVEQRTEIELPADWKALSQPSSRTIADAAISFEYRTQVSGNVLSTTQHYRALGEVIEPAEYPKHFALLREANELLGQRLVVGKAPRDAARERDRRLENLMRNVMDDSRKPAPAQGDH